MKTFFLIMSFFTRLPVPFVPYTEERYKQGIKLVPFIGFIIGLILYFVSYVNLAIHSATAALLLTVAYLILTGGLHLDGMADSCDGLFSGREKDRILEIMRDSRIGAYGVISLILWFAFYLILLPYVSRESLLLFPIIGKTCPLVSAYMSDYARDSGLGKVYVNNCKKTEVSVGILLIIVVSLILCWNGENGFLLRDLLIYAIASIVSLVYTIFMTQGIKKKIGGATGDTLGFICETSQMVFLTVVYFIFTIY